MVSQPDPENSKELPSACFNTAAALFTGYLRNFNDPYFSSEAGNVQSANDLVDEVRRQTKNGWDLVNLFVEDLRTD